MADQNLLDRAMAKYTEYNRGKLGASSYNDVLQQFRNQFGFDYDPSKKDEIYKQIYGADPRMQQDQGVGTPTAYTFAKGGNLKYSLYKTLKDQEGRFDPINSKGLFDEARGKVGEAADAQRQMGTTAIQRASEKANAGIGDQVAGTGVGRSGYVQKAYEGVGQATIQAQQMLEQNIALDVIKKETEFAAQEAMVEYGDKLRIAQWKEADIQEAQNFSRDLYMMNAEAEIRKSLMGYQHELDSDFGWGDALGMFFQFAGAVTDSVLGYRAAGAAIIGKAVSSAPPVTD